MFILFAFNINRSFAQEADTLTIPAYHPAFQAYFNEVRLACIKADTAELHRLFGDHLFGHSCYGGALVQTDHNIGPWGEFKIYYGLINAPEKSRFWNLFSHLSEDGFFYNQEMNAYNVPASHYWGMGYAENAPMFSHRIIFYSDTIPLLKGTSLEHLTETSFAPVPISEKAYPYRFEYQDSGYYKCFEGDQLLGFVSGDYLISQNYYFSFEEMNGKWQLSFFEACD